MDKIKKVTLVFILIFLLAGVKVLATSGTVNAPSGLVLRETASKTSKPITTVNDKETVEIIETLDQWYKVKYKGYEGYLFSQYVNVEKTEEPVKEEKPAEEETPKEEPAETTETEQTATPESEYPKTVEMLSNAKVYLTPSVTASIIYNVEAKKEVTITKSLNSWFHITVDNNSGWVRKSFVEAKIEQPVEKTETESTQEQEEKEPEKEPQKTEEFKSKKGYIDVNSSVNVRKSASTSSDILTTLTTNTEVTVVGEEGDWYKITYRDYTGYISKSFVSDKQVATSRGNFSREQNSTSTAPEENTTQDDLPETTVPATSSEGGGNIAEFAKKYLGSSYAYGGTTPSGFDCSGFVYFVYNSCGYQLSRSCSVQATSGVGVSKSELAEGDMVFFNNTSDGSIGHVGIYIGDGRFIHAANPSKGVKTDTLNSGYYNTYFYSARRLAN